MKYVLQAYRGLTVKTPCEQASVKASDYVAVFYPGGHGPVYDLAGDKTSQDLIKEFYESGRPTASVCHGPAVFLNVVLSDGSHLIKGGLPHACGDVG